MSRVATVFLSTGESGALTRRVRNEMLLITHLQRAMYYAAISSPCNQDADALHSHSLPTISLALTHTHTLIHTHTHTRLHALHLITAAASSWNTKLAPRSSLTLDQFGTCFIVGIKLKWYRMAHLYMVSWNTNSNQSGLPPRGRYGFINRT